MALISHRICAICHGPTDPYLDCGQQPLANGYHAPDSRYPLSVRYCVMCDLYQLGDLVEPKLLFGNYSYRTGVTRQNHTAWRDLTDAAGRLIGPSLFHSRIYDVGGNDGALCAAFRGISGKVLNVDPYAPEQIANVEVERLPWQPDTAAALLSKYGPAKLLTMTNVLAHVPDLHASAAAAAILVDPSDGWLCVQAPWYRDLWFYQEYDTIYHEHVYYLGVGAVRTLFQKHGMDVHEVEYLPNVHGGSLRYWIRHGNDGIGDSVQRLRHIEMLSDERTTDEQERFAFWCDRQRWLWGKVSAPLYAVGAPAKATMFFGMTGLGKQVLQIFDDTPAKQGKRLPGTDLVVEPLVDFRNFPSTEKSTAVLMAWNHAAALRQRLREVGYTGKIVTPQDIAPSLGLYT